MQVRRGRTGRRFLVAVIVIGVVLVVLWGVQRKLIYFPSGEVPPVSQVLASGTDVSFTTSDGLELGAWFVDRGPVAVLVLPGNAGNRAGRAPLAHALAEHGLSVLLVDYRGYGGNPGTPSEAGLAADARAAFDWLAGQRGIEQVVVFGESIGTGVAAPLAAAVSPAALILRSPFPSLVEVAREHYGPIPRWLLRDRFEVASAVSEVTAPTLVIAGGSDDIIPVTFSRRVHEASGGPARFVLVEGAGHNDRALLDGDEFLGAIVEFLRDHGLT